jgi:hypothetical protein
MRDRKPVRQQAGSYRKVEGLKITGLAELAGSPVGHYSEGKANRWPAISSVNRLRLLQTEPAAWPLICASMC